MNRAIRRVGGAIVVLVLLLVGQLTYLQVIDAENLENDPRNVRAALRDVNRPRGPIVTADGAIARRVEARRRRHRVRVPARVPARFPVQSGRRVPVVPHRQQRRREDLQRRARRARRRAPDREHPRPRRRQGVGGHRRALAAGGHAARRRRRPRLPGGLGRRARPHDRRDPHDVLEPVVRPAAAREPRRQRGAALLHRAQRRPGQAGPAPRVPRALRTRVDVQDGDDRRSGSTTARPHPARSTRRSPSSPLPLTDIALANFGNRRCGGTLEESFVQSCNTTFAQIGLDLGDRVPAGHGALRDRDAAAARPRPGRGREHRAAGRQRRRRGSRSRASARATWRPRRSRWRWSRRASGTAGS